MPEAIRSTRPWRDQIETLLQAGANEMLHGLPVKLTPRFREEAQRYYDRATITGKHGRQAGYLAIEAVEERVGYVVLNPKYVEVAWHRMPPNPEQYWPVS